MAVFKCKMCGGNLEINGTDKIVECEYCGTNQTVPNADNEKKVNLFNRATRLRMNGEFDKATAIYESIVAEFPEEAEAYWGLVLSNYGIEYVDDPATGNKIPTCHRASFESIQKDENFELALEYADVISQKLYCDEAREIDRIREEILTVSRNEKPYDIFICYKETADDGQRTIDSVLAQDLYYTLTDKGYRVFFARISLEDKLGRQYEPYIFAALNSAKIMLSLGTKYEYFHAVWVKNEWSRFLKLMAKDKSKVLIPCYKDMDPYDMPDEFKALQAQDLGKVGATQDLMRGIEKIINKNPQKVENTVATNGPTIVTIIERIFNCLEDGDFVSANQYCKKALEIDPKNAQAYLGKLMVELKVDKIENLANLSESFEKNANYNRIVKYGDAALKDTLKKHLESVHKNAKQKKKTRTVILSAIAGVMAILLAVVFVFTSFNFNPWKDVEMVYTSNFLDNMPAVIGVKKDGTLLSNIGYNTYDIDVSAWTDIIDIKIGTNHIVGLKADGTVVATGDNTYGQCDVSELKDIVAIAVNNEAAFGLKSDGTIVSENYSKNSPMFKWKDIVAINAGDDFIVGLKKDGTVVLQDLDEQNGIEYDVSSWKNIVAISGMDTHVVGLKSNGTVVATGYDEYKKCNVSAWTDIKSIYTGEFQTYGLRSDGTVVATGKNKNGQCDVSDWKNIVQISVGQNHVVGLKKDGTVVATGYNLDGKCNVSDWDNITQVLAGDDHTIGLKKDGTVIAIGDNTGLCNVGIWKGFFWELFDKN